MNRNIVHSKILDRNIMSRNMLSRNVVDIYNHSFFAQVVFARDFARELIK